LHTRLFWHTLRNGVDVGSCGFGTAFTIASDCRCCKENTLKKRS
jgi:hypothetical protein